MRLSNFFIGFHRLLHIPISSTCSSGVSLLCKVLGLSPLHIHLSLPPEGMIGGRWVYYFLPLVFRERVLLWQEKVFFSTLYYRKGYYCLGKKTCFSLLSCLVLRESVLLWQKKKCFSLPCLSPLIHIFDQLLNG